MTWFQALVLGLVQGLAEFLPISSSAHLALTPWLLGWRDPGLPFDVALHLGTLVAVGSYFRAEWITLAKAAVQLGRTRRAATPEERRLVFLVIATIPAGLAGLALSDLAEGRLREPTLIATALIVMGIVLWAADRFSPRTKDLNTMKWKEALAIGIAQAFALIPGVSRSGATISGARLLGFTRRDAAVFSFLLSFPVTAAAAILKVPDALSEGVTTPLIVGVASASISSWVAIAILLRFVVTYSYGVFALYRVLLGLAVLALIWSGVRP
ncbi:MAG: undecaprenyl-diphosphatase UppP [Gemmatimonadota bacterium]